MSKYSKILEKIGQTPTPANIKWKDLKSLLIYLGYKEIKGSGSRRKFYHEGKDALIICHEPHPAPDVDKGAISDIAEHLKTHGFLVG